ncbi:unnamed protein product, partial [marine sediment metagenome]
YNMLFSNLAGKNGNDSTFGAGKLSAKNTSGVVEYGANTIVIGGEADGTSCGYRGPAADDTKGILVGSGTDAESFEDYFLQTQIEEGTGAGQLNHILSEEHSTSYADTTLTNTLIRYFNNNSGGSIDVNEVALVWYTTVPEAGNYLASRDKLGSTITVPNTGQLKVTYTVQLTYPA